MYNILKFRKGKKIIKNELGGNKWNFDPSKNEVGEWMNTFNKERDNALAATYGDEWNKMDTYLQALKRNDFFTQYLNWKPTSDSDVFLYSDPSITKNVVTNPTTEQIREFGNEPNLQKNLTESIDSRLNDKMEELNNLMNEESILQSLNNSRAYLRANIGSTYSRRFGNLDKKAGRYINTKTGKAFTAQEVWDLQEQLGGLKVDGDLGNNTYNAFVRAGYIKPKNDDTIFNGGELPEITVIGKLPTITKESSYLPGHFWYNGIEYIPRSDGWSYANDGSKIRSDLSGIAKSLMNNISYTAPKIGTFYSDGSNVKYTSSFFSPPSLTKGNWKTTSDGYKRLINGNTIWVHKGGYYWRSKDNGKTWESTHTKYKK